MYFIYFLTLQLLMDFSWAKDHEIPQLSTLSISMVGQKEVKYLISNLVYDENGISIYSEGGRSCFLPYGDAVSEEYSCYLCDDKRVHSFEENKAEFIEMFKNAQNGFSVSCTISDIGEVVAFDFFGLTTRNGEEMVTRKGKLFTTSEAERAFSVRDDTLKKTPEESSVEKFLHSMFKVIGKLVLN